MKKWKWLLAAAAVCTAVIAALYAWLTSPLTVPEELIAKIDFAAPWTHKEEFLANGFDLDVDQPDDILLTCRQGKTTVSIRAFPGAENRPDTPVRQSNGRFVNEDGNPRYTYGFDLFKDDAGFATFYIDADNRQDALEKLNSLIERLYTEYRAE